MLDNFGLVAMETGKLLKHCV